MARIYLVHSLLIIMVMSSCKAQNNNTKQDTMKTFDIEIFEKNKIGNEYNTILKDSTVIKKYETQSEYTEIIKERNSYFEIQNRYYKNGKIKMEVERFPNQFLKHLKEYNQQGNLIKETDYDKPYKFTFKDVLKVTKKRDIDMNSYGFEIFRNIVENRPMWSITWEKEDKSSLHRVIIDGITGKITKEFDVAYPNEE